MFRDALYTGYNICAFERIGIHNWKCKEMCQLVSLLIVEISGTPKYSIYYHGLFSMFLKFNLFLELISCYSCTFNSNNNCILLKIFKYTLEKYQKFWLKGSGYQDTQIGIFSDRKF